MKVFAKLENSKNTIRSFEKLSPYVASLNRLFRSPNSSSEENIINLPFDENNIVQVMDFLQTIDAKNKSHVFIIGIGGSNLGAKAVYDNLFGHLDSLEPNRLPKLYFLDTLESKKISKSISIINENPDKSLIIFISKSATTAESIENYKALESALPEVSKITIGITSKDSEINFLNPNRILKFENSIGGRFSVFSAVGILPIELFGNSIDFLTGGMQTTKECLDTNFERNPAILSAVTIYENLKSKNLSILDSFYFNPSLESLGKWTRQITSESLGKENKGVTPTTSIGTTDLHSIAQLYLDGPKDKQIQLIGVEKDLENILLKSIFEGFKSSLSEKSIPVTTIMLETNSEKEFGSYMQFKIFETLYLAKLMGVSPFGQPAVELYKQRAKEFLANNAL
mgnify:CR=1 FL=1